LLKQLALPPEKRERFKALLVTHEERRLDVTALAGEKKVSLGDPAIQQLRDNDGAALAREMRALLGPELMAIYQPYRRSLELQPIVGEIVAATYFTPEPLTFTQSQRLRQILAANSDRRANGFISRSTIKWDAAIAQSIESGAFPQVVIEALARLGSEYAAGMKVAQKIDEIAGEYAGPKDISDIWLPAVSLRQ
jgi:hypothetical protein